MLRSDCGFGLAEPLSDVPLPFSSSFTAEGFAGHPHLRCDAIGGPSLSDWWHNESLRRADDRSGGDLSHLTAVSLDSLSWAVCDHHCCARLPLSFAATLAPWHRTGCAAHPRPRHADRLDRKSTRLNSSHVKISYAA